MLRRRAMDVWTTFVTAAHTLGPTPGVREAWRQGRERYAVWIFRVDVPGILARRDAVAEALGPHGVVGLHPAHLTVFVAGFPAKVVVQNDDVAADTLEACLAALRADPPAAPVLAIGGASAFLSCPFLEVAEERGLADLRARLGGREVRFAPYVPHITVGAFGDDRPTGPIAAALAPFRGLDPIVWRPRVLELVTFDAARSDGALETWGKVELGG